MSFEEFERRIREENESFEVWDDYIEWKVYVRKFREF